jgi:hypothetical protein
MTRIEQAAHCLTTMTMTSISDPNHMASLNELATLNLTEGETMAAAVIAREWFDVARQIAAGMDV